MIHAPVVFESKLELVQQLLLTNGFLPYYYKLTNKTFLIYYLITLGLIVHIIGLWDEAGVPGEHAGSTHKGTRPVASNPAPSCCEATVPTTTPPCHHRN